MHSIIALEFALWLLLSLFKYLSANVYQYSLNGFGNVLFFLFFVFVVLCVVLLCFVFFTPRVNQAHDWCHMWGGKIQFEPCLTAVWIKPLVASFLCTFWMGVIVSAIHNKSAFWQEQVFILCKGYLYRSHKYIASCHGPDHCPIYVSAHKQTLLDILSCLFLKARLRPAGRFWTAQHILC